MELASHNSWSYLKPKKWWMRLFGFAAKCQRVDIKTQYEKYGVRCFDLRVRFDYGMPIVSHGLAEYNITEVDLEKDLTWLDDKGDASVRVILEIRKKKDYTSAQCALFRIYCDFLIRAFPNIKFWGGRCLYNWEREYTFKYMPTCEERHASVCSPYLLDDWYPWLYAKSFNKDILLHGTSMDYLMIDFVDYQS